ncbi:MAG TPA: translation elongation factor Ts [Chloroflexota bacterium]|nr:translation elongation factor Ts [Chloroflexota bacterium]
MAEISAAKVKELRDQTGAGIMDCKRALEKTGGDTAKAAEILKEQGLAKAAKKSERVAGQGLVESYVHAGGRIGTIVEVNCETDFVARTDDFKKLAHDLAMQVAATNPKVVGNEEKLPEDIAKEEILLKQPFIKDPSLTIEDLVKNAIAKMGENIVVRRFARFELGA